MRYTSTRGEGSSHTFEEVLLAGLAPDGGLYVPETLPHFTPERMNAMRGLGYASLAVELMYPFIEGTLSLGDFSDLVEQTYAGFAHPAVAPLKQLAANEWLLELHHGPTLAFKDFALQVLGRLVDHVLERNGERAVIMGATSGDTGSAAIEGCRHSSHLDIFILHPHQRVSEIQRRQMTTVLAGNVHNIAIQGNFDDCQRMVKASFGDQRFLSGRRLMAVNSINWCRILAQIVYYFYAALALGAPSRSVAFSVPTGNFGDIYAGYLARNMGLPIARLIVATNGNDILHRLIADNEYEMRPLRHTLSPSMDIVVSSNFERLLYDVFGRNGRRLTEMLGQMNSGERVRLDAHHAREIRSLFDSCAVSDEETVATIRRVYHETGEIIDPHTAIGVHAARACQPELATPVVVLATAHAAKFPEAVEKAGLGTEGLLPAHLHDIGSRPERYEVLPNDLQAVQRWMADTLGAVG